jgi:hypothetical protein
MPRTTTTMIGAALVAAAVSAGAATAASQITGAAIKNGTVASADLKDRSVLLRDLAPSTVRALQGARGPQGPAGPQGPQGFAGTPGPAGGLDLSKVTSVVGPSVFVGPGGLEYTTVYCPLGQKATGGGFTYISGGGGRTFSSRPTVGNDGWSVHFDNYDNVYSTAEGNAYAVCVAS